MHIHLQHLLLIVAVVCCFHYLGCRPTLCEQLMPRSAGGPWMKATACTGLVCCRLYKPRSRLRRCVWLVTVGVGAGGVQLPPAHITITRQCMHVDIGKQVHGRVRQPVTGPCTVGPEKSRRAPSCVRPCMPGRFSSVRRPSSQSVPDGCTPWWPQTVKLAPGECGSHGTRGSNPAPCSCSPLEGSDCPAPQPHIPLHLSRAGGPGWHTTPGPPQHWHARRHWPPLGVATKL